MIPEVLALVLAVDGGAGGGTKLMAYNVLFKGADDAKSLVAIADEAPDVLCLTELTPAFVAGFEKALGAKYPHRKFHPTAGAVGVGLASRYPIEAAEVFDVPPTRMPALEARLRVDGKAVTVTCVHLMPAPSPQTSRDFEGEFVRSDGIRRKQAEFLVARCARLTAPLVLLGDFNEEPGHDAMKLFEAAGLARACERPGEIFTTDAFYQALGERDAGAPRASAGVADAGVRRRNRADTSRCGATFPGPIGPRWPAMFVIDHVLGRGVCFTRGATVRAGGSDHFPVTAEASMAACAD